MSASLSKKTKKICGFFVVLMIFIAPSVWADDFVPSDDEENAANVFVLDADNSGGDIDLQFGSTLSEVLRWDSVNTRFMLSDDLSLEGNELVDFRIQNLAAAPTCDASALGKLYYNTTDKLTYSCDGVSTWNPLENALNATIEFPVVQARRTTSFALPTTYGDVDLDTTDLENDTTSLDHDDTDRDRINIGATAMYQIIYGYTAGGSATSTHEARARVRVNDATVLPGSESVNKNYQGEFSTTSASFLANLSDGDFISLQLQRDATNDVTQDEIFFSIVKLEGIKGDPGAKGDKGDPGSVGLGTDEQTFTLDQDNSGSGVNVDIIAEQGTDNNGTLRYDATANEWQLSNDGGAFEKISSFSPSVFYGYDATGGQAINTTQATLNIDTAVVSDAIYSLSADEVTVSQTGLYKIRLDSTFTETNTSGGPRTSVEMTLEKNETYINGAYSDCYVRETEENTCSLSIVENISAGEVIRARLQRTGGTTNIETVFDGSRLIIEKIR